MSHPSIAPPTYYSSPQRYSDRNAKTLPVERNPVSNRFLWDRTKSDVGSQLYDGEGPVTQSHTRLAHHEVEVAEDPGIIERGTVNKIVSQVVLGEDHDFDWQSSRLPAPGKYNYQKLKLPRSNTSVVQDQIGHKRFPFKSVTQSSLEGNAHIKPGEAPCRNQWDRTKSTVVLGQLEVSPHTRYETSSE
eukprot:6843280-Pyramimonas_sp.AAC.1